VYGPKTEEGKKLENTTYEELHFTRETPKGRDHMGDIDVDELIVKTDLKEMGYIG
jgi:hypothetical protein